MKKFIATVSILVLGTILYRVAHQVPSVYRTYTIQGKKYQLLEAKNKHEWEQGLMYKNDLKGADGMIFLFPDQEIRVFWNKNTYLNLDILWMKNDVVVGKSYLPSIKAAGLVTVASPVEVNRVVELVHK